MHNPGAPRPYSPGRFPPLVLENLSGTYSRLAQEDCLASGCQRPSVPVPSRQPLRPSESPGSVFSPYHSKSPQSRLKIAPRRRGGLRCKRTNGRALTEHAGRSFLTSLIESKCFCRDKDVNLAEFTDAPRDDESTYPSLPQICIATHGDLLPPPKIILSEELRAPCENLCFFFQKPSFEPTRGFEREFSRTTLGIRGRSLRISQFSPDRGK